MIHPQTFPILRALKDQLTNSGFTCGQYKYRSGFWSLQAGYYLIKISINNIVDITCVTRSTNEITGYSCDVNEIFKKGIKRFLINALMNDVKKDVSHS